jgi:hypothetical protein
MENFENHKLPVPGEQEATDSDSAKIVTCMGEGHAHVREAFPKLLERINVLRYCVSEEIREMWAALTKKREWHVEWLEAVIRITARASRIRFTRQFGNLSSGTATRP